MTRGNGYIGSNDLQTTTSTNFEVVPLKPVNWTMNYSFDMFSFYNPTQSCHVSINGGNFIYLGIGQGFESGSTPITSFIIAENGISYNFLAEF